MDDCHILNLKVELFPEEYRPIVRRLQQAAADRDIREAMEVEDDVTGHFRIEERIRQIKLEEKDMIIAEKETALAEKETELTRERAEKEKKEAALAEKETALARERAEKEEKEAALAEKETVLARERAEKEALLAELAALKANFQTGKK
jgi:hypothetical protein